MEYIDFLKSKTGSTITVVANSGNERGRLVSIHANNLNVIIRDINNREIAIPGSSILKILF